MNVYGFLREGNDYPVHYRHDIFEKGKYSELVHIRRRIDAVTIPETDNNDECRLREEYNKLNAKYRELLESSIQFREQINQGIENNRAVLLEHYKYRKHFSKRVRKFFLYFYLKTKYIDSEVIDESHRIMQEEQKHFDPEAKYCIEDICVEFPPLIINYMQQAVFFINPIPDFAQKSLNIVLKALERKTINGTNEKWFDRMRNYLVENKPDNKIKNITCYDTIKEIKVLVDDMFKITLQNYDRVFDKFGEHEYIIENTDDAGVSNNILENLSQKDCFSLRTLQNMLILDGHDLLF